MGKLLIAISGARREILEVCPTERIKFQSLGWAILITSGIATVSMWFALDNALGLNPAVALPLALLWGLVIMGIDRWLITSIPPRGSRRWVVALPRLLLALLLGTVISTPIVLRIFQTEITNEIAQIDAQRANSYLANQQRSQVTANLNYWQDQVSNAQDVIKSRGQTPLNFSADPQLQSLNKQLSTWLNNEQKYYNQWQCQLYGIAPNGLRCKPGNGPLSQNSHQSYVQAKQQVTTLNGEIAARKATLSSSSTTAAATRLKEAQNALPHAQQELQYYQSQQDNLRNQYESTLPHTGLLIRLQALGQLSSGDFTVAMARFLIFLLFLVIECLPVTVKLMQRPGNYELALERAAEAELKRAYRDIRASEGLPGRPPPAWPVSQEDRIDQEARQLWQMTQTMPHDAEPVPHPVPYPGGPVPTPRHATPPDSLTGFRDLAVRHTVPEQDPGQMFTRPEGSLGSAGPVELPLDENEI